MSKRAISEDRPELIELARQHVTLASRIAESFQIDPLVDPKPYIADLKKRFLLSTTMTVVAGIFSDEAVAAPIDPTPLRRNSEYRIGVGLAEQREKKVAIDAPVYQPDQPFFGFVVSSEPQDEWYVVREKGDFSFVLALEHEWIRGYGADLVMAREVLGLGREAEKMSEEARPHLTDWIERAKDIFARRWARLKSDPIKGEMPGFYHFGKEGFCRHPWDEIVQD